MKGLGIDIGTTTISTLLVDLVSGMLIASDTCPNDAGTVLPEEWKREQDPKRIFHLCKEMLDGWIGQHDDIAVIGVTGQMHGILYIDKMGQAVGNLRSWQDGRGNLIYKDGKSYAQAVTEQTGGFAATGFGLVTLFYDAANTAVPEDAVTCCTIGDYVAMQLCGQQKPQVHASNAAGMGGFDLAAGEFKESAAALLDNKIRLPRVVPGEQVIGTYRDIPVCCAIGDNQAAVAGSMGAHTGAVVNVGTGSQISVPCDRPFEGDGEIECRPYINGGYLSVGAALCGGYAYSLLRDFFEKSAGMMELPAGQDLYGKMEKAAQAAYGHKDILAVDTRFAGTRQRPDLRGAVYGIGTDNLEPGMLCLGVLQGICNELFALGVRMGLVLKPGEKLAGSGSGLRQNQLLRRIFTDTFGADMVMAAVPEEAALGAALVAAATAGQIQFKDIPQFVMDSIA